MKTQNVSSGSRSKRFPCWLRQSIKGNEDFVKTKALISQLGLNTVCQTSRCPNIHGCFSAKRCTFLILGKICTRHCRFCAVEKSRVLLKAPDKEELLKIKEAVQKLGIKNAVITSVTRDDLNDGGAGHFADCIDILRNSGEGLKIEALVPDFLGDKRSIEKVTGAKPDIFSHNLETVPRLYSKVRPGADYGRSLDVLRYVKELDPGIITKSGIMTGLGEFREEIRGVMRDLRKADCDIITIGQYLKPGPDCLDVEEFLEPGEFDKFSEWAKEAGFKKYYCGPFVRSSYTNPDRRSGHLSRSAIGIGQEEEMAELKLPELAEGVNEAVVSFWHFKEGDSIKEGDEIVEMATDKAAFNVPCKFSGILKKKMAQEGDTVKVGQILAIIE